MPKVLGQAGVSLADIYDVEGSIAGVEELASRDVGLIHEMGATILSERLRGEVRALSSGAILQTVNFDTVVTDLPAGATRIAAITVVLTAVSEMSHMCISVRDDAAEREIPIWNWTTGDDEMNIRLELPGAAIANTILARPIHPVGPNMPSMLLPFPIGGEGFSSIAFRGASLTFGAGTVTATALIYLEHCGDTGISSRGLPIPSW